MSREEDSSLPLPRGLEQTPSVNMAVAQPVSSDGDSTTQNDSAQNSPVIRALSSS